MLFVVYYGFLVRSPLYIIHWTLLTFSVQVYGTQGCPIHRNVVQIWRVR
jgi:hypothetical protein